MSKPTQSPVISTTLENTPDTLSRRNLLKQGAALAGTAVFAGLGHHGVWAAGSDKPELEEVKIGFIPLTDCASVVRQRNFFSVKIFRRSHRDGGLSLSG